MPQRTDAPAQPAGAAAPHATAAAAPVILGLRERKKAQTRQRLQDCALRLFREQGYAATTVQQITEAAEVSESTFYRFFPSKRELVLTDDLDPLFVRAVLGQPARLDALTAIRNGLREVLSGLSGEQEQRQRDRLSLLLTVPELRAAMVDQLIGGMGLLADVVAQRTGRSANAPEVRTLAGAVIGAAMAAVYDGGDGPREDIAARVDESMAWLARGLAF